MNKRLSNNWKRHAALPVLLIVLAVLAGMTASAWASKDHGLLTLVDIEGSGEALQAVAVSGELRDAYHRTRFELKPTGLTRQTKIVDDAYLSTAERLSTIHGYVGNRVQLGDLTYRVYNTYSTYQIDSGRWHKDNLVPVGKTIEIQPPLLYHPASGEGIGLTFSNLVEYGLAMSDGKIYYTVPVSNAFSGQSPIYELSFASWNTPTYGSDVDLSPYMPREVARLSLERNEDRQAPAIGVLGLEGLPGGKLALLITDEDQLKIRSYEAATGRLLGEVAIADMYVSESAALRAGINRYYSERYEAHIDPEQSLLTVVLREQSAEEGKFAVLTLDLTDEIRLVHDARIQFQDGYEIYNQGVSSYSYIADRLYVLKSFHVEPEGNWFPNQNLYPQRLFIYVYQGDVLQYKGELQSDRNDDLLIVRNYMTGNGGLGYNESEHRLYADMTLRPYPGKGTAK